MPTLDNEVSYLSGVDASGAVVGTSFHIWDGNSPATYTGSAHNNRSLVAKWGARTAGTASSTINYVFDPAWTTVEQNQFRAVMAFFSAVANITFNEVASLSGSGITITKGTGHNAFAQGSLLGSGSAGTVGGTALWGENTVTVSIDPTTAGFGPMDGTFTTAGGYPWLTIFHEIGHAVGLGHSGPYNEGDGVNADTAQYSAYDSTLYTVMSYINPSDPNAAYFNSYADSGTNWGYVRQGNALWPKNPVTLMPLDILALQRLYGTPTSATTLTVGHTFGFNTDITGPLRNFYDFSVNTAPVVTIWDSAANNVLDLSGFTTLEEVNLNPGTYSSVGTALASNGNTQIYMLNNIAIGYGTAVNTLFCGSASDAVICNNNGDTVHGGAGNDGISGGFGNDTLWGDSGANSLFGGAGIDTAKYAFARNTYAITHNSDGTLTVTGNGAVDTLSGMEFLSFTDITMSALGTVPFDFNGNGTSDVLWKSPSYTYTQWLMNGASIASNTALGSVPSYWAIVGSGDFNGDGKAEVLWHHATTGAVEIDDIGPSGWVTLATVGTIDSSWSVAAIGDFNGDGNSDILWQSTARAYSRWTMNGTSAPTKLDLGSVPSYWTVAGAGDFNGDGKSEILWHSNTTGAVEVDSLSGSGWANLGTIGTLDNTWSVAAIGDFNGDGTADILWQSTSHTYSEWLMSGASVTSKLELGSVPSYWTVADSGDFNGDGKSEIIWHHTNGTVEMDDIGASGWVTLGTVGSIDSSWSAAGYAYGNRPKSPVADLNGDGRSDILWKSTSSTYSEWLMSGAAVTSKTELGSVPSYWQLQGVGEFTGDGRAEILWHHATTGAIEIDGLTASGWSNLGTIGTLDNTWAPSAIGDFDGDGKTDILWQSSSHTYSEWLMGSATVASKQDLGSVPTYWSMVGSGDFNGDGKTEVVWHHNTTGAIEFDDLGASGWNTQGTLSSTLDSTWSVAAIGDFNGDGNADILWQSTSNTYSEWLMNGTNISSRLELGSVPAYWTVVGSGDFDGDGKSEIIWHHTNGTVEMDGIGVSGWVNLGTIGNLDSSWSVVSQTTVLAAH